MAMERINKIFDPDSVAVIGASERDGSVGRDLMENLEDGFKGKIYPINPNHDSILNIKSYSKVSEVKGEIDLAVIAVPSRVVPDVLEECGKAGIKSSIIISAGFGESGSAGEELEQDLVKIGEKYDMRIMGPNCMGILSPPTDLNISFLDKNPKEGNIAFVSQSGALGSAMLDWSTESNVGISNFVSIGNMIDVNFADLIEYLGEDENTDAIMLYIEGISDSRKFLENAQKVSQEKPIFVLKSGKHDRSAEAVASHTGSIAGADDVYDIAFKRAGITRLESIEEFFDVAKFLSNYEIPQGSNILIVTNAGGPGVLTTDSILDEGGYLAELLDETIGKLEEELPEGANTTNPVDVLGDADKVRYRKAVDISSEDENVDGFIVIYTPQGSASSTDVAEALVDLHGELDKPFVASWIGGSKVFEGREFLSESNITNLNTPERAASTYLNAYENMRNRKFLSRVLEEGFNGIDGNKDKIKEKIEKVSEEGRSVLTEAESKELLDELGIPISTTKVAENVEESVEIAEDIGYPVAMKIHSEDISHKSDVGGVMLGLESSEEVKDAFSTIMENVENEKPEATIGGVTVQEMVDMDYALILGSKMDPVFGPVVMFGRGGRDVELYSDTALELSPLNRILAENLIEKTNVHKFLEGYRNYPPVNKDNLIEHIINFSYLSKKFPKIGEVDINPLAVVDGKLMAIDARVILNNSH